MKPHTAIFEYRPSARRRSSLIVTLLLLCATSGAMAQQRPSPVAAAAAKAAAAREQTSAPSNNLAVEKPPAIDPEQALYLVRSALLTLNDANRCGNYTVLRDLATPDFQARNTAADLAQSFADLRRRHFDLFAAALLAPKFTTAPALDTNGRMRLTGFFPTRAVRDQLRPDVSVVERPVAAVCHLCGHTGSAAGAVYTATSGFGYQSQPQLLGSPLFRESCRADHYQSLLGAKSLQDGK